MSDKELTGQIQASNYWNVNPKYSGEIPKESVQEEITAVNSAERALNAARAALNEKAQAVAGLPKGWRVDKVTQQSGRVFIESQVTNLLIVAPPVEKPQDPYEAIRSNGHFVQILNSGVLTRAEKRKVLGLPEDGEKS